MSYGEKILDMGPAICKSASRYLKVNEKTDELGRVLQSVENNQEDMLKKLKKEEGKPGKKRKKAVDECIDRVKRFKENAKEIIDRCNGQQWIRRMVHVPQIDRCIQTGNEMLELTNKLQEQGLTIDEACTRRDRLPVGELKGETANRLLNQAHDYLRNYTADEDKCIGIYGSVGAGKTFLMKHLHNKIFDEPEEFKAVYWASAPDDIPYNNHTLQEKVANAMWFKLNDQDEVRRASQLYQRFKDIAGAGRIVLFLDNVREQFDAYEILGMPRPTTPTNIGAMVITTTTNNNNNEESPGSNSSSTGAGSRFSCTLVFTAPSKDVCNRMRCNLKLKVDLLTEQEALELFSHEAHLGEHLVSSRRDLAEQVARQCARMPLAITLIARSMAGVVDIFEWRNLLDELLGNIENIHNEEGKILELLKFGYSGFNHNLIIQRCFLASTTLLAHDEILLPREQLIQHWRDEHLICQTLPESHNQGSTILNMLERTCLLEFVQTANGDNHLVRMNKWIRKMAQIIDPPI